MAILKADDLTIGMRIIGLGTVESWHTHVPMMEGEPVQVKNCQDNRYNNSIYEITGIMLPYISIKSIWNNQNILIGRRESVDFRRFQFMKVTKEFEESLTS